MPKYTKLTGDPKKGAVPPGEYNVLEALYGEFQALTGFQIDIHDKYLLMMANANVMTLSDFGHWVTDHLSGFAKTMQAMPWAKYGLSKDEYVSSANIFGTTYKEITGQDISPAAQEQAFRNPRDPTGGLLTGSEYKQQLMNDATLQKQYGWIKYGMDFSQWTQQKLQLRSAFGRDINDAEAATILQYQKAASGSNLSAIARSASQQQPVMAGVGVGGSLTR